MKKEKVVIGMSGGVDSSVAALLLIEHGFDVIGLFMNNWQEKDGACTSEGDWADVQNICGKLKIPCYSVDFSDEYRERVFSYFLDEYTKGRTPNPDVLCNREIKFGKFAEYSKLLGADYVATGHYCGVANRISSLLSKKHGNLKNSFDDIRGDEAWLIKAKDQAKDQTYFLNQVSSNQLSNVIFPLSHLDKGEVRQIAKSNGFVTSDKKDSTGVCFIGERNFRNFLSQYLPARQGDIVDTEGNILGTHQGLMYHTLGQRKGLGIGGQKGYTDERWYVIDKDMNTNRLIVSCGEGEELFSDGLITYGLNFIGSIENREEFSCYAKFRYRQPEQRVTVRRIPRGYKIDFAERQRAVTHGQFVVLYDGNRCLGGGVIEELLYYK